MALRQSSFIRKQLELDSRQDLDNQEVTLIGPENYLSLIDNIANKMIWKQSPIGTVVESFKTLFHVESIPKFTRNTACFICKCVDRFLRAYKLNCTKRLQRKGVKSSVCGRKYCRTNCTCSCSRCNKYSSLQKKRVLDTDLLADLAYNHRVSRSQKIVGNQQDNELNNQSNWIHIQDPVQDLIKDHRDVPIPKKTGQEWWTSLQHGYMPPLCQGYPEPTRSDYSSVTSGFRSETPNTSTDSLSVLKSVSVKSNLSDTRSCPVLYDLYSVPREALKLESKIGCQVGRRKGAYAGKTSTARTLFRRRPKRNTRKLFGVRRKIRKRKISQKTTCQPEDTFSTCARCSTILSVI